ncbi:hypothetical protein DQ353_00805 [Arthrobacter sp. AQ5-05]|nr:hypothetical protein DQ353_00805 [Arthrobacter sp. AQ5-05]
MGGAKPRGAPSASRRIPLIVTLVSPSFEETIRARAPSRDTRSEETLARSSQSAVIGRTLPLRTVSSGTARTLVVEELSTVQVQPWASMEGRTRSFPVATTELRPSSLMAISLVNDPFRNA